MRVGRLAAVFAGCALPRLAVFWLLPAPRPTYNWLLSDSLLYNQMFALDGAPTTYVEPLYPAFLAAVRWLSGDTATLVLMAQIGVAASGGVLLYLLGLRMVGSRAALLAAAAYALYPYLVRQSVAYLALNLIIPIMFAVVLLLMRTATVRQAAVAGIVFGLLVLTRATFGLSLVAASIWLGWRTQPRVGVALLAAALAIQVPWALRNQRIDGSLLPTRIGENLLVSTSEYAEAVVPTYDIDALMPLVYDETVRISPHGESATQAELDRLMLIRALRFVRDEPWRAALLKLRNLLHLVDPRLLPRHPTGRNAMAYIEAGRVRLKGLRQRPFAHEAAHAAARTMLLLLALLALWIRRIRPQDEPLLLMAVTQASFCVAFFPTSRLLLPTTTLMMIYAGTGAELLPRWIRRRG